VTGTSREFGEGPLARVAALVHTLLVVGVALLLATAPGLLGLVALDRDPSNAPLAAACLLPVGPAVSAALYALRHRGHSLTELAPAAAFLRGYRVNLLPVLAVWVPYLAWLGIVAVVLAHRGDAGIPTWWSLLLVVLAVLATLWVANALLIRSLFTFRTRDLARLAGYFLLRTPSVPVGVAGLLALAGALAYWSPALPLLIAPLLVAGLLRVGAPMLGQVREQFTAPA
jgi:hypothetical protein